MKSKLFTAFLLLAFTLSVQAQMGNKQKRESPPAEMTTKIGDATIVINYSQPSVKGREIYGGLVPYDKVWRTGANEATTFSTDKDITVNGEKLKAGTYTLFTIPGIDLWTIIFNSELGQWGAFKYDASKDVLRVKAKAMKTEMTEKMTFIPGNNGMIYLDWAETRIPLKIES